jgi:hypothetical protein
VTWFERHPRRTLSATVAALLLAADAVAGQALAPREQGAGAPTALERYVAELELHEHRIPSEAFHHGFRPNDHFDMAWGGLHTPYWTNALALRDGSIREIRPDQGPRLVVLGDSYVEGLGVPYEETFVGLLASRLAPAGIEVLDAGVAGYSPKLYLLKLRWLLEEAHLRIDDVAVFVDTSDPHNEIEYETWAPTHDGGARPGVLGRAVEATTRWSFTARVVNAVARRWRGREDDSRLELLKTIDDELYDFDEPEVSARWGRRGLDLCDRYMQQLADLCRARGIRLTVAVHPASVHVLAGDVRPRWVEHWEGFARRNQATFVDLFPVFLDPALRAALPPAPPGITPWLNVVRRYYIEGDVHWNGAGHRLVAESLAWPAEARP